MALAVGSRTGAGDNISGFNVTTDTSGKKLTAISGKWANGQRGASVSLPNSDLPKFADLGSGEKLVFEFDTYFHDANSSIQLFGITSSDTGEAGTAVYDPYLSITNNSDIPIDEWVNVKLEIDNTKNVILTIRDMNNNILSEDTFTAVGELFEKAAFYGGESAVDIDNFLVYTTDTVEEITIAAPPSKIILPLNSELDLTGMVVNAKYIGGAEREVTNYTVSGFDNTKLGTQTITVEYQGKTATFEVEVQDLVIGIEITKTPDKTRYAVSEELDLTGIVVSNVYSSGAREEITDYTVSEFDNTKTGLQALTVTNGEFSTELNICIPADEMTMYYNDDFNSYTAESITMTKQGTEEQAQDLGMLELAIGKRNGGGDGVSGFDIVDNSYLKISSGRWANTQRGVSFAFDEVCNIPLIADLSDGKALYISFDMMLCDGFSSMTIDGVTGTASTSSDIVNDTHLSADNTAIPQGEWVNVIITADNQRNGVVSIKNSSGEEFYSAEYVLPDCGIEDMKFTFYGGSISKTEASVINLDNLKVYEDYFVKKLEVEADMFTYYKGEELSNLKVKAIYSDNTSEIITDYQLSGYDMNTLGTQEITVSYGTASTKINIEVVEDTTPRIITNLDSENNTLTARIENGTQSGVLILAIYDENDILEAVSTKVVNNSEEIIFEDISADCSYRLFAWDSLETIEPIADFVEKFKK